MLALATQGSDARPRPGYLAALGIVAGVPLSAGGTIIGSGLLNWLGVLVVATGVAGVIGLLLSQVVAARGGFARVLLGLAALALAAGISLGVGWSSSLFLGVQLLDHETMVRTHGVLNVSGVLLAALAFVGRSTRA